MIYERHERSKRIYIHQYPQSNLPRAQRSAHVSSTDLFVIYVILYCHVQLKHYGPIMTAKHFVQ